VVRALAGGLDPASVELHVVTVRPALEADNLDDVPVPVHPVGHAELGYRWWKRPIVAFRTARRLQSIHPDVVHLHSGTIWLGILAPLFLRRSALLVEVHDAPGSGRHGRGTDRFERWFVRATGARVVVHSNSVADDVCSAWGIPADSVALVPLAVDTDRFAPLPADVRSRIRQGVGVGDEVLVVVAGRLVPSKRVDIVLDVVAEVPGLQLLVVGRGELGESLRLHAEQSDLTGRVRFTGFVDDEELARLVGAADVVVSASEYEGFGLALVEAMSCGVPVVATAAGGVADVVVDGVTGALVAVGDKRALRDRLEFVSRDPALRERWGRAGRKRAIDRFSIRALGEGFGSEYEGAARSGRRMWRG